MWTIALVLVELAFVVWDVGILGEADGDRTQAIVQQFAASRPDSLCQSV